MRAPTTPLRCLISSVFILLLLTNLLSGASAQGRRFRPAIVTKWYVTPTGNDGNGGTNWGAAFQHVQRAINAATAGDQIWVKAGTYFENITLKASTSLYGGFNGTELSLGQRNLAVNSTVLDGNQAGSVVTMPVTVHSETTVDGFIVRNGSALGQTGTLAAKGGGFTGPGSPTIANCLITGNVSRDFGGGLDYSGTSTSGDLMILNCTISNNTCLGAGGGLSSGGTYTLINCFVLSNTAANGGGLNNGNGVSAAPLSLNQCVISGNNATGDGGGIYQESGSCTVSNCTFTSNSAGGSGLNTNGGGGANIANGSATFANSTFTSNMATNQSGGALNFKGTGTDTVTNCSFIGNTAAVNGGVCDSNADGSVRFADCLMEYNSASFGGALSVSDDAGLGTVTIANDTFYANSGSSATSAGAINCNGNTFLANNVIAFNSSGILSFQAQPGETLSHNCVYGNTYFNYSNLSPGAGDISVDPQFIDAPDGDYHLLGTSPCINAGNDAYVVSGDTDLDGNPVPTTSAPTIGCYQFTSLQNVTGTVALQGAVNSQQTLIFTFRPTIGSPWFPRYATLNSNGNFTLTNVPPGLYTVAVVGPRYLNRDVTYTVMASDNIGLNATLLAGDVNGDNVVDISDFSLLATAFGSDPSSNYWNPDADLNNDGVVDITDFSLIAGNFGVGGDP